MPSRYESDPKDKEINGGADPDCCEQEYEGECESYKGNHVAKVLNGKTHPGKVMLYGKASGYQEDRSIKKYPTWQIKFNNKCVTNVDDSKEYEEELDRDKVEGALELHEVEGGIMEM